MSFSQQYGYKSIKQVQRDSMDENLRIDLWNIFYSNFACNVKDPLYDYEIYEEQIEFLQDVLINFLKRPIDELPNDGRKMVLIVKQFFLDAEWYEVYDLLEYNVKNCTQKRICDEFIKECNRILENEASAYRFIGSVIAPIIDELQIEQLQKASEVSLKAVQIHLERALSLYSDRQKPDYRNSIKESICAVEAVCCIIIGNPKAQLGDAIKKVKEFVPIHGALEVAFNKIYAYTSDENGIRHKLMEESNVQVEDALFMLGACSSFINYMVAKAGKSGIIGKI